jgi:ubiquinone/menaquinone biosynthesis C-methylase UbiE
MVFMIEGILHQIAARPRVYEWLQRIAGAEEVGRYLAPFVAEAAGKRLLDVGAGTGIFRKFVPESTSYIWVDNDPQKLSGYRRKQPRGFAALADGTYLCFGAKSIDYVLCVAVLHHLNDEQLGALFNELARVVRHRVIVLDPIDCRDRMMSNVLWRYDRGSFPRTPDILRKAIEAKFKIEHVSYLTVYHRYMLCVGSPRGRFEASADE